MAELGPAVSSPCGACLAEEDDEYDDQQHEAEAPAAVGIGLALFTAAKKVD